MYNKINKNILSLQLFLQYDHIFNRQLVIVDISEIHIIPMHSRKKQQLVLSEPSVVNNF